MQYLKVKNWDDYQHYKKRCPPWIKLHTKILNDRHFTSLSLASRGLLMQLWILASEYDGKVPNDLDEIKFRLRNEKIKQKDINLFIEKGLLICCKHVQADDSKVQADATPEAEAEAETETKTDDVDYSQKFEEFWKIYPRKIGKKAAYRKWKQIKPDKDLREKIHKAVEQQKKTKQWKKENGQFIPHPATWLNQGRWDDEIEEMSELKPDQQALAERQRLYEEEQKKRGQTCRI